MSRALIPMEHLMFDKKTLAVMGLACLLGGCVEHGYPVTMPPAGQAALRESVTPARGYSPIGLATPTPNHRKHR